MLKIEKNSRQIPKSIRYTADKNYNDLVYGYFQLRSIRREDGKRYIRRETATGKKVAETLNKSQMTASKYVKGLFELGLIRKCEEGAFYEVCALEPDVALLIPEQTLEMLEETQQDKCISIYAYLLNSYCEIREEPYRVTFQELKPVVGLSAKNNNGVNAKIEEILELLMRLGLIEYKRQGRWMTVEAVFNKSKNL